MNLLQHIQVELVSVIYDASTGQYVEGDSLTLPKEMRVSGSTTLTELGYPNQATIEIFNLGEDSLAFLEANNCKAIVSGGQNNNMMTFFQGNIMNYNTLRQDTDLITTLYVAQNGRDWHNSLCSVSFEGEVSYTTILEAVALSFRGIEGVDITRAKTLTTDLTLRNYVASGLTRDALTELLTVTTSNNTKMDLGYFIVNNTLVFTDFNTIQDETDILNIKDPRQIIQNPIFDAGFLTVVTQFSPKVLPSDTLRISSQYASSQVGNLYFVPQGNLQDRLLGDKRIREIIHTFDTRGSNWHTSVKANSPFSEVL